MKIADLAADPDAVRVALERLVEAGADPTPHREGWIRLLDASPASVEHLVHRPALVDEIPLSRGEYDREHAPPSTEETS